VVAASLHGPAAIAVPLRAADPPDAGDHPFSALALLALVTPTAAIGSIMLLHHFLA
jgi:hypothetical protein